MTGGVEGIGGSPMFEGLEGQIPENVTLEQLISDWGSTTLSESQYLTIDQIEEAGVPILNLPWPAAMEILNHVIDTGHGLEGVKFLASIESQFNQIGSDIWDKYIDHLRQEEERRRDFILSPAYEQYVEKFSATVRNDLVNQELRFRTNIIDAAKVHSTERSDSRDNAVAFGAFVLAAITIPAVAAVDQIGTFNVPAADVAAILPTNMQEMAILTVNLFVPMIALPNTAMVGLLGVGGGQTQQQMEKAFAKKYAQGVLAKLGTTEIDDTIAAMGGDKNTKIVAKLMLIASAMALIYNAEVDWNAGAEFLEANFEAPTAEMAKLAELMQGYLGMLPKKMQDKVKESLIEYFSSKPSMKEITKPLEALTWALQQEENRGDLAG